MILSYCYDAEIRVAGGHEATYRILIKAPVIVIRMREIGTMPKIGTMPSNTPLLQKKKVSDGFLSKINVRTKT